MQRRPIGRAGLLLLMPLLWLLAAAPPARACDGCGCSAVQPALPGWQTGTRAVLGLRYRFVPVDAYGLPGISDGIRPLTEQHIHIAELWARVRLGQRWAVSAFVPGIALQRTTPVQDLTLGLGDATVLGQFALFPGTDTSTVTIIPHMWQHRLQVGLGVKAPTGRYQDPSSTRQAALQPALGTGSWDVLTTLGYAARYRRWAFGADAMFKYNNPNTDGYRFGHRLMLNLTAHYQLPNPRLPLQFTGGAFAEHALQDRHDGYARSETGGIALYAQAGADWMAPRFTVGLLVQQPVAQRWAQGYVSFGTRVQATVNLLF